MKTLPLSSEGGGGLENGRGSSSLRVVALCAGDSCLPVIRRFLKDQKLKKEPVMPSECGYWKMTDLLVAANYKAVAELARDAEMIIVSTGTGREVPSVVRYWLEASLKRGRGAEKGLLVALVGGSEHEGSEVEDVLRVIAVSSGAKFEIHYHDPVAEGAIGSFTSLGERSATVTSVLSDILKHKESSQPWRQL